MRLPIAWTTLKMLLATGILYLIMMGSTFSSLGVVLPHMIQSLGMDKAEAGFGFTLLALIAATSSLLPAPIIRRWGGRFTLGLGVLTMVLAYTVLATCGGVVTYDLGAALLGLGFALIGAVPGLHILSGWEHKRRSVVFGAYLAFGGLGGALWPNVVEGVIGALGDWRAYWSFMAALMAAAGAVSLTVVRERVVDGEREEAGGAAGSWTLMEALRTPQFYVIGCCIAATYFIATIVNAFTVIHLTAIGVGLAVAIPIFEVQSGCHALFPLLMGGIAERVGVKNLLVFGLAIQVVGMLALAVGKSFLVLTIFAIGVGGGYGTIFLATTVSLQAYFGRAHYAAIFGANQVFTIITVVGPTIVGWVADRTGRFDISFAGCAVVLLAAAIGATTLRPPEKRRALMPAAAA